MAKYTKDIQLPNTSGPIDPRIDGGADVERNNASLANQTRQMGGAEKAARAGLRKGETLEQRDKRIKRYMRRNPSLYSGRLNKALGGGGR